jgi:hypothetical protein
LKFGRTIVIASLTGTSLILLYVSALTRGIVTGAVIPASNIEAVIVGTLLARLLFIWAIPRIRRSSAAALNIMSAEVLLLPLLVFISLLTSDPIYLQLIRGIFFAWPAAFMAVSPLYTIPKLVQRIEAGSGLSTVIPALTSQFALLTFLDVGLFNGISGVGLSNVTKFALQSAAGVGSPLSLPSEMIVTGVAACAAMIFYALRRDSGAPITDSILGIASAGALLVLGWGIAGSYGSTSAQLVFGAPALVLLGLIWGFSRAH